MSDSEVMLIEGMLGALAMHYSRQLSHNIQQGIDYDAPYIVNKLFKYRVDEAAKITHCTRIRHCSSSRCSQTV